jgi:hypothetical protein
MQTIASPMSITELQSIANQTYGNLVKAVVDLGKSQLAIDGILHADLEHYLLEQGSLQTDLWGINLHPNNFGTDDFIEYDSMINLRPNQNNFSRGVDDIKIRKEISKLVSPLFKA